ncbi:2,3-dehydroadipyl-CoA hydratase PaaF [Serratia entomophila]|jgi:enoyl-CoA hydratase|uniref:2,3-dehydroadipyl-CoA hydratase n=1 Tax=Serratia entomophila TaxID=42906 RepID=A0ABY5CMJ0_9GAMM|nr:2,3-dehydroadipyl-CoA hydratase PaaF [Serratia entomophila]USU99338.1 2,3-dehydroadipyl-CoA hydratase [Serratia entomophila]CAI0720158.1 Probable enoyl-CoA hydratase echA8 [Serratia entomophila]CAI0721702.1 Probable enoyl-CoA hydratase echA8 [Serratia entomophila]CAI0723890.1 Probable enoyl-CoA hydratase echA8 [Serratia entomophila]CAI0724079.1 Probable enoyl-CoA hydratase echA8 [Serratia entomophila]
MDTPWILRDQQQRVVTLTLHRPDVRNALSTPCLEQLVYLLEQADADNGVGAVVIGGAPRCFAAGADLRELQRQDLPAALADRRPQLWQRLAQFSKPLLAAVNGYALGAGCELALACDIIICGESARFGLPEITLGLMPGAGGTQRLIRCVGKSRASQMVLTGEAIDARSALQGGLVSEVCVDALTLERAQQIAERISRQAPLALRAAKQALKQADETGLSQGLAMERQQFVTLAATDDRREGIAAFFEKRTPNYQGR